MDRGRIKRILEIDGERYELGEYVIVNGLTAPLIDFNSYGIEVYEEDSKPGLYSKQRTIPYSDIIKIQKIEKPEGAFDYKKNFHAVL